MVTQKGNVCIIGSFSLDSITVPGLNGSFHSLGGAVTYTSFAVKSLGETAAVISRVGADLPEAHLLKLHREGINISAVKRYPRETTTHFELCYNKDFSERTLKLTCKGYPISLDDIPHDLYAKIIHVAPIAGEINYDVVEHLKTCCSNLSLDPQGFLRSFDENGNVSPNLQADKRVLELVDICKVSQDEIFVLTDKVELNKAIKAVHDVGVKTVIVTMGAKGALLSFEGEQYNIPACHPTVLVDPTGAGDVFIGAFLSEYLKRKELLWCASIGSAAASMVVEGAGSTWFGERQEIIKRAISLYEKELKQ
ncbi:MAG: carbohydrate kinase family protein [Nitrososphaerota archaeon]|jgi:sugar/nucleoside kinase (ribokinase family)|nr:carbohydrate kinase family protein [Nitrososphaerota archaeon]